METFQIFFAEENRGNGPSGRPGMELSSQNAVGATLSFYLDEDVTGC